MPLSYTFNTIIFIQQAVVERDMAALDVWGGEPKSKREVIGKVPCRFWWWREGGARSAAREYATPQRTIEFTGGAVILPKEANIIAGSDHIASIQDMKGKIIIEGPFRVTSMEQFESHCEAGLMRP